jgi:multidrug efflux pump subunit AcrB
VPSRCAAWLRPHGHGARSASGGWFRRFHHGVERFLGGLARRYERVLRVALRFRALVLSAVALLFLAALGLLPFIGREFFPQVDSGQLTIYFRCTTGTKLEKTNERLGKFEAFLKEHIPPSDLRMIVSEVGTTTNWSAAYTANSGPQDAVVKVQLTDERSRTAQEFAALLRHRFEERQAYDEDFRDLRISFDTGGMVSAALNYGASSPIEVQVVAKTISDANAKAREIRDLASTVPGTADVRILQRFDYPQIYIEIDRKEAQRLGLNVHEVFQTVTTALNSSVVVDRNFWLDPQTGNQYWVGVQYEEEKLQTDLEEVKKISLTSRTTGKVVELGELVTFRRDSGPAELTHDNLANVVSVMVNTEGRDLGGVAADIQAKLDGLELPRGMTVRMSGEYQRMTESFGNLGLGLVLAAVLVYLLMVAQFRSYLSPLIILFAVPLGLIGVLFTLYLTRTTLNVQSAMGVIFMVGIVVANSTLLVDFANRLRTEGVPVYDAITAAARIRLRPILMTFLATFLDLLPMAIGMGKGSEANVPLARAVVGGLLASTCLTLFVVPIMYTLFNRDQGELGMAQPPVESANGEQEETMLAGTAAGKGA